MTDLVSQPFRFRPVKLNSTFGEKDWTHAAPDVLKKKGTVLMVWEHTAIPPLAGALGVSDAPKWEKHDFDSIWIITFPDGKATLNIDQEGIKPTDDCPF